MLDLRAVTGYIAEGNRKFDMIMKKVFAVKNMGCASCARAVETAANSLPGVSGEVNFATAKLTVRWDKGGLDEAQLYAAVRAAGYDLGEVSLSSVDAVAAEAANLRGRLIVSAIFTVLLLYLTMGDMVGLPLPTNWAPHAHPLLFALAQLLLTLPVMMRGGEFYRTGLAQLWRWTPNMDSLVAVGTLAAFAYSLFAVVMIFLDKTLWVHFLYFESAAVILTLITLGKFWEVSARRRANDAVTALLNLTPPMATVIRGGSEIELAVDQVALGELIAVRPGGTIALDGVVEEGESAVDESMLTGESTPVAKQPGSPVVGGSINQHGFLKIKVTHTGGDTMLAKIVAMVESAQNSKAPIAALADTVAGYFVSTVMKLAILAAAAWLLVGEDAAFALNIFVSVLVIACPCALGLATPISMVVASGRAAKRGILFKSSEAVEACSKVTAVLLDKTGTLTMGKMYHAATDAFDNWSPDDVLILAASLEQKSEHLLGQSIVAAAKERKLTLSEVTDFMAYPGHGLTGRVNGHNLAVGSLSWLESQGVAVGESMPVVAGWTEAGRSCIGVAADGRLIGVLALADELRPESAQVVVKLKAQKYKVIMVSGDRRATAQSIAAQAGIDEVFAEVLPGDKAAVVKQLQSRGEIVAMVGDGINDAPALAAADVGIAVGGGTDIAVETADAVLSGKSLQALPEALLIGKLTLRNVKQNLFWAFAYNIVGIPVAMGVLHIWNGPLLNPMIAAAAMSLSSVSVVLNALRLKTMRIF